jgi:hypothetical protein
MTKHLELRAQKSAAVALLLLTSPSSPPEEVTVVSSNVYCVPNTAAQACIRASLTTTLSGGFTVATLRLSNLQGTQQPGIVDVPWARLHTVELLARDDGQFQGGAPQGNAPITLSGDINEYGEGPPAWVVSSISEAGIYVGYSVFTDIEYWGAEIIGCIQPPDLAPPYYQSCATVGNESGDFVIRFTTAGTWDASQVGLVFGIQDDQGETGCAVNGTLWTHPELPLCLTPHVAAPNQPPTAVIGGPYSATEGTPVTLNFSASDPDLGDVLSYAWDLGDGTTGSGSAPPTVHSYSDNGTYVVKLDVTDGRGGSDAATATVVVQNVAPSINSISGSGLIAINASAGLAVAFSDAGSGDTHSATIDWGNGTTSHTNIASGFTATRTYAVAGVHRVTVSVSDDDGGTGSRSYEYIVVYDPTAGFVTGGGWINYDANACAIMCARDGRGDFGFVAKYEKGKMSPSGATQFQFHAGTLMFESIAYEWLVVAGARAQFKGAGRINGNGDYGFLLTAVDGAVSGGGGTDRFRIKIWDRSTGIIVFDNESSAGDDAVPTIILGGGSIVLHTPKK